MADAIADGIDALLARSRLKYSGTPGGGGLIMLGSGDYWWQPLDQDVQRLRGKLKEEHRHYATLMRFLLKRSDQLSAFSDFDWYISSPIEQSGSSREGDIEAIKRKARESLQGQINLLGSLYDGVEGVLFVPDTNALLHNPRLETWAFPDAPRFTVVLTPTVLSELDELKVAGRHEAVRSKAESLIRTIKEYRSRGDILSGVPIVTGRIDAKAMPVEPKLRDALSWLDPSHGDDRILAITLEVCRSHPRSVVALVTRDINLQNKCEFARMPYVEPPDPPVS